MNKNWMNSALLTDLSVKEWANMGYWNSMEAVKLSMGLNPNEGRNISDAEAESIGSEFVHRFDILCRSLSAESVEKRCPHSYRINPDKDARGEADNKDMVHDPEKFTMWAKKSFASFPDNLYLAVVNSLAPSEENNDKSNSGSKGNPGSNARWAEKREIVNKAEEYVEKSLQKGCECCDHCQLADYMYQYASDDQVNILFDYPKVDENTMLNYLKEGAKRALKKDYPHRIVGNTGYKKSDGICEVHPIKR